MVFLNDHWGCFLALSINHNEFISEEGLKNERLETCLRCDRSVKADLPKLLSVFEIKCNACLCFVRLKAALSQSRCPLGRWRR